MKVSVYVIKLSAVRTLRSARNKTVRFRNRSVRFRNKSVRFRNKTVRTVLFRAPKPLKTITDSFIPESDSCVPGSDRNFPLLIPAFAHSSLPSFVNYGSRRLPHAYLRVDGRRGERASPGPALFPSALSRPSHRSRHTETYKRIRESFRLFEISEGRYELQFRKVEERYLTTTVDGTSFSPLLPLLTFI